MRNIASKLICGLFLKNNYPLIYGFLLFFNLWQILADGEFGLTTLFDSAGFLLIFRDFAQGGSFL
jgi:hypothetical protein